MERERSKMKAEETVMKVEEMQQAVINRPDIPMGQAIAEAQAKVTWDKAVRTVVEWMNEHQEKGYKLNKKPVIAMVMLPEDWQAQLKEWGIK